MKWRMQSKETGMSSMASKGIVLGKPLRAWQKDCCSSISQFSVLVVHRRAGKTEVSLLKLMEGS